MRFRFLRIAAVRNSAFASFRLCYVKYLNMLCNFTVEDFVVQIFLLYWVWLDAASFFYDIFMIMEFVGYETGHAVV
jgi:hypothetical protein